MMLVLSILPFHKALGLFIMCLFNSGMYAKYPVYVHAVGVRVCVCSAVS